MAKWGLSTNSTYQQLDPETAAWYVSQLQKIVEEETGDWDPNQRARIAAYFDAPTSAEGIAKERKHRTRDIGEDLPDIGPLGAPPVRRLVGAASRAAAGIFGAGPEATEPPAEYKKDLPIVGEQDPLQFAASIGMALAPFVKGMQVARGIPALARIASPVGRQAATMGLTGAGVETMRQSTAGLGEIVGLGTEADISEIPIAAGSFAVGGVPANRLVAALMQASASAALQKGFKGKVDPNRVAMETLFAFAFGNPAMKDMRAQMEIDKLDVGHLRDATREVNTASNAKTAKGHPKTIVDQLVQEGELVKAKHVKDLSKLPDEVLDTMNKAGEPNVARTIRDAKAEKNGMQVVPATDAPATRVNDVNPGIPKQPPTTARIARVLKEHGELNTEQLVELLGVPRERVWRAIRTLETKGGGRILKEKKGPYEAQHYRLSEVGKDYAAEVAVNQKWNWRRGVEDDLTRQAAETAPDYTQGQPDAERAAVDQRNASIIKMLEDLDDPTTFDPNKYPREQLADVIDGMIGGRALEDLRYEMKSAGELPPEWNAFRDLIEERVESAAKPKPIDAEIHKLVENIEQSGEVRTKLDDAPRVDLSVKDTDLVKDVAAHYNIKIEEITGPSGKATGWKLLRMGSRTRDMGDFTKWDDVVKRIQTMQRGEVNTMDDAFIQAKEQKLKLTYSGKKGADKVWRLSDPTTGGQVVLKDFDAVKEALHKTKASKSPEGEVDVMEAAGLSQPEAPVGAPHLEPTLPMEPESVGPRVSVPGSDSPIVEDGGVEVPPHPDMYETSLGWWDKNMTPMMDVFQKLDDLLGHGDQFTLHRDVWQAGHEANAAKEAWQRPFEGKLNKSMAGIPYRKWDAMQDVFVSGRENYARTAKELGLNKTELAGVLKIRQWYKDLLSNYYNRPVTEELMERFIEGGIVPLRDARGNPAALADYTVPAEFEGLLDDIFDGTSRLDSSDIMTVADYTLRSLGNQRFVRPVVKEMRTMLNGVRNRKNYTKDQVELSLLNQADELSSTYIDMVTHRPDQAAANIARHFMGLSDRLKNLGMIRGDELSAQDVQRISMMMSSWFSGTVMSFRQALTMRNLWQPMLAAPKVGAGRVLKGWVDAFKSIKSGEWAQLQKSGVVTEPAFFGFGGIAGYRAGGTVFQAQAGKGVSLPRRVITQGLESLERGLRQLQSAGLKPFRGADQLNRVTTYFAGKRAILEEAHWLGKDLDEFLVRSGLAGDSRSFQNRILKMMQKGQTEEAAVEYGKHVSRSTQYMYSKPDVPTVSQGTLGRAATQFGVWPMAWTTYMQRQMGLHSGLKQAAMNPRDWFTRWSKRGQGKYARTAQERYRALFTARYIGQLTAIIGAGAALGIDTSSWNRANVLKYHGGPALQVLSDLSTLALQTGPEFQREMAASNVKRFFTQLLTPAGAFVGDAKDALARMNEGEDALKVLAEFLGFTITE